MGLVRTQLVLCQSLVLFPVLAAQVAVLRAAPLLAPLCVRFPAKRMPLTGEIRTTLWSLSLCSLSWMTLALEAKSWSFQS